ncbi:MAG: hypothetical protein L6R28_05955 [Planctomycetes bacterium]|nr:hypothetical protein [Planctomycetota bacterium]
MATTAPTRTRAGNAAPGIFSVVALILLAAAAGAPSVRAATRESDVFERLDARLCRKEFFGPIGISLSSANFPMLHGVEIKKLHEDLHKLSDGIEGASLTYEAAHRALAEAQYSIKSMNTRLKAVRGKNAAASADAQALEAEFNRSVNALPGLTADAEKKKADLDSKYAEVETLLRTQTGLARMPQADVWSWIAGRPPEACWLLVGHLTREENKADTVAYIRQTFLPATGRAGALIRKNLDDLREDHDVAQALRSVDGFGLAAYWEIVRTAVEMEPGETRTRLAARARALRELFEFQRQVAIVVLARIGTDEAQDLLRSFARTPLTELEAEQAAGALQWAQVNAAKEKEREKEKAEDAPDEGEGKREQAYGSPRKLHARATMQAQGSR